MTTNVPTHFPPQTYSSSFFLNVLNENMSTKFLQLQHIISTLYFLILITKCTAIHKYDCVESQSPITRTFISVIQYRTNNLRFNTKSNFVDFDIPVISHLEKNTFLTYDSNYIIKLTLSDKRIERIDVGAFNELYCVKYLLLQNNSISQLKNGTFEGLHSVEELDLSNNHITHLSRGAFWDLKYLLKLDLSQNQIVFVSDGALDHLEKLIELNLRHNRITEFSSDLFRQSRFLFKLYLGDNQMSAPSATDFKNLHRIDVLDLSNNSISQISDDFFINMTTLTDLNLTGNLLNTLNVTTLPKLERIHLQDNLWQCNELQSILKELEDLKIDVVVNKNTKRTNVNVSSVGCYKDRTVIKPTTSTTTVKPFIIFTTTEKTVTVINNESNEVDNNSKPIVLDNVAILDAVNNVKTLLVILIIFVILFVVIDVVLKTQACSRLRQRRNMIQFPVLRNADDSLPLLNRY